VDPQPGERIVTNPEELRREIETCVEQRGACLLDLFIRGRSPNRVYEIFIDNEQSVTLEFCSEISRDIKSLLDRITTDRQYRLVVSSPGFDRPLKYPWQFKKHVGKLMQVRRRVAEGIEATTGRLVTADGDGFVLLDDSAKKEKRFDFGPTVEAKLKAPW
jgi:ribosome maturation factor RimP